MTMDLLDNPKAERERRRSEATEFLKKLQKITDDHLQAGSDPIGAILDIRKNCYENLNQIPHALLILDAIDWIDNQPDMPKNAEWRWHPAQRGGKDEPDLALFVEGRRLVSAEVTASNAAIGTIDGRMKATLDKLSRMEGKLFYFVNTSDMAVRAKTKVRKKAWPIQIVDLSVEK